MRTLPTSRRLVIGLLAGLAAAGAPGLALAAEPETKLRAYLDGRPIPISDVGRYQCDDFEYPVIRCSSISVLMVARATAVVLLTGVDYVTMFDGASFTGASMSVSQDYGSLLTIGWSDRVSSFKGRNSESGRFNADWWYGGNAYYFCCNHQFPSLAGFNNTFSSVQRT